MIRPIKNINDRPQIEWYTEYSSTSGGAIVHKKEYDMALEIYCDHLEKALDEACNIIVDLNDCTNRSAKYPTCPFREECEKIPHSGCLSTPERWKEYLLNGDNL